MGWVSRACACAVLLGAFCAAAGCGEKPPAAAAPRFYYDLGPDSVDVSAYPPAVQDGYALFRRKCAACHTLARPINSPYQEAFEWDGYLKTMAYRGGLSNKMILTPEELASIRAFLLHDAEERKVKGRARFQKEQAELKSRFAALSPKP